MEVVMFKRNAAVLLVAALVLGVGAYAWAQGAPDRPTTADQAAPASANRPAHPHMRGGGFGGLLRAIHGDVIVRQQNGTGFENVTFDRGQVTAVSASSITVKRADGQSVTKSIDGSTKFRGAQSAADVKTGKGALVVSKGSTATLIGQPNRDRQSPPPPAGQ
jgi:hypothetical protein